MFRIVRILLLVVLIVVAGYLIFRSLYTVKEKEAAPDDTSYTVLRGVFGERKTFRLPDGSTVILNTDSRLKVPRNFNRAHRRVILEGDAFFEVAADAQHPFMVTTPVLHVSVLGTSSRFTAPAGAAGESLELLSGRLKVEKAYPSDYPEPEILQTGDMILINKDIDLMEKEQFDTAALSAWKTGRLVFTQASFPQVIRRLEDWYATDIEVSGNRQSTAGISGVFLRKSLQELLDILGQELHFRYRIRDHKVEIIF
jgi:ferric-dicitrate binding protein FerR (iron transport regulator)